MSIQQLLAQAKQAEQEKQWAQAVEMYSKVLQEMPNNQPAKEQLGWCLSLAKQYKRAIDVFQELAQSQPQSAKWPYMIGYQYHEQEQWREAIKWYEKSLGLNPDYIVVLYRKGYSHFKLGQVGEALQAFERCRTLWHALPEGPIKEKDRKNCAKAAYHQAEVSIENPRKIEGALEGAIRLLGEAISLDPQNHNAHYLLGKALLENGQAEQAIAAFQESDRLQPNQDYVLDRWGQALAQLKQFEEAEKIYQRIPPGQRKGYVLRNLGELQLKKGDYQRAITTLKQALQKDSRSHYGHYYLGLCYQKTSEWGLAVRELREAVRLRKKNHNVPFPEAQKAIDAILSEHPEAATVPQPTNTRQSGKVVKYLEDRGFGFIQGDNGEQIFFHFRDFRRDEKIEVGIRVEYEEAVGDKGPKAIKIKRIDSDSRKLPKG
ncbi:MAG: tetratricopeptide repeat protein [Anaerolineales bacterium]|nr:tetratricopeptide repeat protein [Anaerolineales bacterium]